MKNSWRDLMPELNALDREIGKAREREIGAVMDTLLQTMDDWSISIADLERQRFLRQSTAEMATAFRDSATGEVRDGREPHRRGFRVRQAPRDPDAAGATMKSAADSPRIAASTRSRVQQALAALPGRGGVDAVTFCSRLFEGIRELARAWGGTCLSEKYVDHTVPFEFTCAEGHRFSMRVHGLRLGHWRRACAYERATVYPLDDARAAAESQLGHCLSRRYRNNREPLRWRCEAGHTWSASLEQVLRGDWCQMCHFDRIKPRQQEIDRAAVERGGICLSAYVDKETPLQWQCAEGHTWSALWFRIRKGQWCHQCAVKARTRTIEQMQVLAHSRGGRCLSTVYPGAHGKIEWQCGKGHAWHASVNSVWRGSWCPECAWESRRIARRQAKRKNSVPIMI
ncbi:zinc-ribbon domain-containing protein [Burkholderia ubonensis]|uniref:zinc-ribbon domain-containing protein n=1 Tax=Burkholderia ubonensis TaxID=101571 RepID=UPI000A8ACA63|nr:zinc-ribbon domain-containing protein [Burkholderia ubonensis]